MLKKYLTIFLISMVPILELRGAIPYSVGFGLPSIPSFIVCVIGNMIPVPFIYWFARRVLEWGKDKRFIGKFFTWCLVKGEHGGQKLMAKSGTGVYIALLLFVGIPLPGTGAWTGTLAASFLERYHGHAGSGHGRSDHVPWKYRIVRSDRSFEIILI